MSGSEQARRMVTEIVAAAGPGDWSDPHQTRSACTGVLDELVARPDLLADLLAGVSVTTADHGCESYPQLDKLVLWRGGDLRLRLHVFLPGYGDRPHSHRWSFASRILAGGYLHSLYGSEDEVLAGVAAGRPPVARYVRWEGPGAEYLLDHSFVHSLRTDASTVSLLLRGPAVKDRYFTIESDPDHPAPSGGGGAADWGRLLWSTGSVAESPAQLAAKAMTEQGLRRAIDVIRPALMHSPVRGASGQVG